MYFVRAEWLVEGRQGFAASLWLRTEPRVEIIEANVRPASWLRMFLFRGHVAREQLGLVLNVVDWNRDGWGEVLFLESGYEGFSISLRQYSATGFTPTDLCLRRRLLRRAGGDRDGNGRAGQRVARRRSETGDPVGRADRGQELSATRGATRSTAARARRFSSITIEGIDELIARKAFRSFPERWARISRPEDSTGVRAAHWASAC